MTSDYVMELTTGRNLGKFFHRVHTNKLYFKKGYLRHSWLALLVGSNMEVKSQDLVNAFFQP